MMFNPATNYWSVHTRLGKWAVMYMCVMRYRFCVFLRLFCCLLELFWLCTTLCFYFIVEQNLPGKWVHNQNKFTMRILLQNLPGKWVHNQNKFTMIILLQNLPGKCVHIKRTHLPGRFCSRILIVNLFWLWTHLPGRF
jgi:hypothetical protein